MIRIWSQAVEVLITECHRYVQYVQRYVTDWPAPSFSLLLMQLLVLFQKFSLQGLFSFPPFKLLSSASHTTAIRGHNFFTVLTFLFPHGYNRQVLTTPIWMSNIMIVLKKCQTYSNKVVLTNLNLQTSAVLEIATCHDQNPPETCPYVVTLMWVTECNHTGTISKCHEHI